MDETIEKIKALEKEGNLTEDKYKFLTYMLSKKELSYKDISIITLSLFGDGLGTVGHNIASSCGWEIHKHCSH